MSTKITKDDFKKYEAVQNYTFKCRLDQPSVLSVERQKKSGLIAHKYIYIYEHYEELKKKFNL